MKSETKQNMKYKQFTDDNLYVKSGAKWHVFKNWSAMVPMLLGNVDPELNHFQSIVAFFRKHSYVFL